MDNVHGQRNTRERYEAEEGEIGGGMPLVKESMEYCFEQ